jgi:hypothetical protein
MIPRILNQTKRRIGVILIFTYFTSICRQISLHRWWLLPQIVQTPNTNQADQESVIEFKTWSSVADYTAPQLKSSSDSTLLVISADQRSRQVRPGAPAPVSQNKNSSRHLDENINTSSNIHNEQETLLVTGDTNNSIARINSNRSCRVIIVNTIDYHHEIIESVVNRFPLPWHTFNCSTKLPIIYDFSLFQNRFPDRIPFYIGEVPKYLNETEFWGWKDYFEKHLQYRKIPRSTNDGTVAFYRNLVPSSEEHGNHEDGSTRRMENNATVSTSKVDAVIDISCEYETNFTEILKQETNRYCVLHKRIRKIDDVVMRKSCWLSPMYPNWYCTFLPIDLPKVDRQSQHFKHSSRNIHVCAVGSDDRNHTRIVDMFSNTPFRQYNATLFMCSRSISRKAKKLAVQLGLLNQYVKFIYIKDFYEFDQIVSS